MENPAWVKGTLGAVSVFAFLYDVITFPVYLAVQQPWKRLQLSKRTKAQPISSDDKQITYRSVSRAGEIYASMERANVDTLDKMLTYAAKLHGDKKCLGTRKIISEEDEVQKNGRVFKKYTMGEYEWRSFTQVENSAVSFGRGLRELGHEPRQNTVIFAETRAEWMIAAHGINETEATVVITSHDLLPKFKKLLAKLPKVRTIVYMKDQLHDTKTDGFKEDVRIVSFNEVIDLGSTSKAVALPPSADDISIIMYTSGSTGTPKGVLISHKNCMATLKGFSDNVKVETTDVLLGILPLAHVFELLAESLCVMSGVSIGYSSPTTLTDSSTKIKRGNKGDVSVLRPTAMTSVPLILYRISKEIHDKVRSGSAFQRGLFEFAYDYKKKWIQRGFQTPILDMLVFKQVKQSMGGRLRVMLTGGAPLSPETQEYIRLCLCIIVVQGYALTETTSGGTVGDADDLSLGRAGVPLTTCDFRLRNWDEGGYRVSNKPHPQGEIIIGGDGVSRGYYKLDEKTAEEFFDEDGRRWFKTGDIGEFHEDGVLKIIDRKKDLVKLQAGEYISLGKVETQLMTCPIVDNTCVYADSSKQFCVALIVPNPKHLRELAFAKGISDNGFEELCKSSALTKAVVDVLAEHGKKCKLQKFEIPAAVTLCTEIWTPDSGLVTAALKLKRKDIQDRYRESINRMYGS